MPTEATTIAPSPVKSAPKNEFKVAEIRDDGTAVLQMEDGRMFPASVKEGLGLRKHAVVTITSDGEDKDGTPEGAAVTGVKS